MSVRVFRIPDEPILIATFERVVTAALMRQMYEASAALITTSDTTLYRITDFRNVVTTPAEVLQIYALAQIEQAGSTSDPRIRPVLLGDNQWSNLARDMLWEHASMELPIFDTMSSAINHIHLLMQYSQRGPASAS